MKLILKQNIINKYNTKDFEFNPLNSSFITVGNKLVFYKKETDSSFKEEKTISRKIDCCDLINYIKEENQLFASSTFYIKNSDNSIYKCDSSKKKVLETIFSTKKNNIQALEISSYGKIVYVTTDRLYYYDSLSKIEKSIEIKGDINYINNIYIYNENILLKSRKMNENSNVIKIYSNKLDEICKITIPDNCIFIKLIGIHLFVTKIDGFLEVWDVSTGEIYDYKKISSSKITYIANDDEWYYFGNSSGEIIVTNDNLEIIDSIKIFKNEIKKIKYLEDTLYVLSENGELAILSIIDDDNKSIITKFMTMYNIHSDYTDFFTTSRVTAIQNFLKKLKINNINYMPSEALIFRALQTPLLNKKVCILGKDPYFQPNVATGLAFEVKKKSWGEKSINASLKNMLKLIYYSYTNERKEISDIRKDIDNGKFKILAPDKLFKSWEKQGVLLLNTAFTVVTGSSGTHHKFWDNIIKELMTYISIKNPNIVYLLWGKDAQSFDKNIISGEKIMSNHPAISGNIENASDFANGKSFILTKDLINWLGE